jgi:16S rRNA G966 N2-methylase RsmD
MNTSESESLSFPLNGRSASIFSRFAQLCCCFRSSSPSSERSGSYTELKELKDLKDPNPDLDSKPQRTFPVIVPVQAALSPAGASSALENPSPKKKSSKKKGLPVVNTLSEGYQVIGNGKETVIATMSKTLVEFNKTTFRSDIKKKPDFVPLKYWNQRYSIFSRFDDGVLLDEESWYSVTHECIAKSIADRLKEYLVMDGFAGAGGNIIQFAMNGKTVAVEIDQSRIDMLKTNAEIYGVLENIRFVKGDFLEVAEAEKPVDVVFMSPPWGGPDYVKSKKYDLFAMITPDITKIMEVCNRITKNVVLYLPRTAHPAQIVQLFKHMPDIQRKIHFELFCVGSKVKTICCFMGEFNNIDSLTISNSIFEKIVKIPKYLPKDRDQAIVEFAKEIDMAGLNTAIIHAYSAKRHPRAK